MRLEPVTSEVRAGPAHMIVDKAQKHAPGAFRVPRGKQNNARILRKSAMRWNVREQRRALSRQCFQN